MENKKIHEYNKKILLNDTKIQFDKQNVIKNTHLKNKIFYLSNFNNNEVILIKLIEI